ncbi:MAG: 4-hydroxy-3-methylbut-2-enyl diphosphate reductase [Prevotellaceae bacterium]|nr:4-hydroxy-3-methylbut-2-enyl diphosphate reductase [Prevotellaceae bacterium]MCD8284965.1 4-hydroxy-3-methylbut-2-enyl diphosphate reductase [Prevotellaceae bacterium]
MVKIEIDKGSGFCFGVTRAISKAEEELSRGQELFCLGDIVHNGRECDRLEQLGLKTIEHKEFNCLRDTKVLLRAHGEPPTTYLTALRNGIEIIDATCPVVLQLQRRIRSEYEEDPQHVRQIVIFGQRGHAEVLGLVGQTEGEAIVIETPDEARHLDFNRDISLYSQTTKSLAVFRQIVEYIAENIAPTATFRYFDTICRQVANRMGDIHDFARRHDVVLFVCGRKSSNGLVLYRECVRANARSYMIDGASEINLTWLAGCDSVGICGATSTPKWLMEECRDFIERACEAHSIGGSDNP